MTDTTGPSPAVTGRIGAVRIAIGFLQGVVLWALTEAADDKVWPATTPGLFGALAMIAMFAPFVLLGGLTQLRPRTLAIWAVFAAAVLAALGLHDMVRRGDLGENPWISPQLMTFAAAGLFIAHHLVEGGDAERKLLARYPRYFDTAWKHGVQLVLSAGFVGVFWIVLFLGAALFNLIGVKFVGDLIEKPWFFMPATGAMFAAAVHLTDVRPGLIRGIRTVALTLLSWLLPVLALLAAAFLLTLPFTGLQPLWETRSAAGILLSAAAVLIVLMNAAYQDGEPDGVVPPVLRFAGRLGGLLLVPLVALSIYALWLRIGQHGLTPDRIVGAACALVGTVYAVGYAWAALRLGRWLRRVEATNVTAAFLILAVLLVMFSPIADPARLSVNDQVARLAAGKVTPEKFDYAFLRFDGQRYGREALLTLKSKGGEVGKRASEALARDKNERWIDRRKPEAMTAAAIDVWPKGRTLPGSFLTASLENAGGDRPVCTTARRCDAAFVDLNRDGREEILLTQWGRAFAYTVSPDDKWTGAGTYAIGECTDGSDIAKLFRDGPLKASAPRWDDLEIAGRRFSITPYAKPCETKIKAADRVAPEPALEVTPD